MPGASAAARSCGPSAAARAASSAICARVIGFEARTRNRRRPQRPQTTRRRHGRLATGGIVGAVVEQQMPQVRRPVGADGREGSHPHQRRAVPVERDHASDPVAPARDPAPAARRSPSSRPCRGGWRGPRWRTARGRKSRSMPAPRSRSQACARRASRRACAARAAHQAHGHAACSTARAGVALRPAAHLALRRSYGRDAALLHQQRIGSAGRVHDGLCARSSAGAERRALRRKELPGDLHGVQHRRRDRTHQRMLRLIRDARLAAPGDDQQLRQAERPGQGGQRADRIAQPGVLHHGDAARCRRRCRA